VTQLILMETVSPVTKITNLFLSLLMETWFNFLQKLDYIKRM